MSAASLLSLLHAADLTILVYFLALNSFYALLLILSIPELGMHWWLAEHVAESVTEFLRTQREATVVPVEGLTRSVRQVLQVIGYAEVGRHFEAGRPMVKISLVELAQAAGTGYELAFFDLLGRRLDDALGGEGGCFELFGIERCVKMLRAKKVWSRDCETLRDEIVSFTRDRTGSILTQADVRFSVA